MRIKITEGESLVLEKYWYERQAMINLVNELTIREANMDNSFGKMVLDKCIEAHINYQLAWAEILQLNNCENSDEWKCDFVNHEIVRCVHNGSLLCK